MKDDQCCRGSWRDEEDIRKRPGLQDRFGRDPRKIGRVLNAVMDGSDEKTQGIHELPPRMHLLANVPADVREPLLEQTWTTVTASQDGRQAGKAVRTERCKPTPGPTLPTRALLPVPDLRRRQLDPLRGRAYAAS